MIEAYLTDRFSQRKKTGNLECNLILMYKCMLQEIRKIISNTVVQLSLLSSNIIILAPEIGKLFVEPAYLNSHILVWPRLSGRHFLALQTLKISTNKTQVSVNKTVMRVWYRQGQEVVNQPATSDLEASWLRSTRDHLLIE